MRIAIFVEKYPAPYKTYFDAQFGEFVRAGHDVSIYSGGSSAAGVNERVLEYGLQDLTLHYPESARSLPRELRSIISGLPASTFGARQAVRVTAGITPGRRRIVDAARVLSIRGPVPDICIVHGLSAAAPFSWLQRAFPHVPIALYYHGGELPTTRPISDAAATAAFRAADVVFTNTAFSRDHAIARGCPPERIHVLPVGFALEDYNPPVRRRYRPNGTLRLLSAGRMSEEKGFEYAVEAVKLLVESGMSGVSYALTGGGYYRARLETLVRQEGLEQHVHFLGTLSTAEVIRAMGEADVLLLPSTQVGNWVENQACAVQEAMLMQALVVVSRTGGVPESIPPEMEPFICEPGDPAGIAEAIRRIDQMADTDIAELGDRGRSFVLQRYDIGELNRRLLDETLRARAVGVT